MRRTLPILVLGGVFALLRCATKMHHGSNVPGTSPEPGSPLPPSAAPEPSPAARHRALAARLASNPHVALGIPADSDPSDDVLLDERTYVLSYNPKRNSPNWAAWQLDRSYLGTARRSKKFRADSQLPRDFIVVEPEDYTHSGYERGHLCPSGDRTRNAEENALTFLMTNVVPQVPELNNGPWEKLEAYERTLVGDPETVLYIVAGGVFADDPPTIGRGVAVPFATYKVIVALRAGQTADDVTPETNVVAAMMPNDATAGGHAWTDFVKSVDEIERATGYDFLPRIPSAVEDVIEAKVAPPQEEPKRRSHKAEHPRRARE